MTQINSGLAYVFGWPENYQVQIILLVIASALATLSVASGLDRGVRRLSELNMALAAVLLVFVLMTGPTVFILQTLVENIGAYLSSIPAATFKLYAYEPASDWIGGWTIFYWGWWLAWAPFVGLFIARISRGRTIRQFVVGVLSVPVGFVLLWLTVFGDAAIYLIMVEGLSDFGQAVQDNVPQALFIFLGHVPLTLATSFLALFMVIVFFVTSADSGALVIDMMSSRDDKQSPVWQRIFGP